jgi:hypothetical protein
LIALKVITNEAKEGGIFTSQNISGSVFAIVVYFIKNFTQQVEQQYYLK